MECVQIARRDETTGLGFKAPKGHAEDDDFWEKSYNKTVQEVANGTLKNRKGSNAASNVSEDGVSQAKHSKQASRKASGATQPTAKPSDEGLEEYQTEDEELFGEFVRLAGEARRGKRVRK